MFLGARSARFDPDSYLEALIHLHHVFTSNQPPDSHSPLIIDADGWIKGMGFDLLVHFINAISPDFTVCLEPPPSTVGSEYAGIVFSNEIEQSMDPGASAILSVSSTMDVYSRSKLQAADLRTLSLHAYFSQVSVDPSKSVDGHKLPPFWDFDTPLTFQKAFSVDWDDSISVMVLHGSVPRTEILYALNATLVALVSTTDALKTHVMDSISVETSELLGYGFVKSIRKQVDEEGGPPTISFQIITPLSSVILEKVNVLVRGSGMDFPSVLYLEGQNRRWDQVAYSSDVDIEGVVGARSKQMRYNLPRRRLQ